MSSLLVDAINPTPDFIKEFFIKERVLVRDWVRQEMETYMDGMVDCLMGQMQERFIKSLASSTTNIQISQTQPIERFPEVPRKYISTVIKVPKVDLPKIAKKLVQMGPSTVVRFAQPAVDQGPSLQGQLPQPETSSDHHLSTDVQVEPNKGDSGVDTDPDMIETSHLITTTTDDHQQSTSASLEVISTPAKRSCRRDSTCSCGMCENEEENSEEGVQGQMYHKTICQKRKVDQLEEVECIELDSDSEEEEEEEEEVSRWLGDDQEFGQQDEGSSEESNPNQFVPDPITTKPPSSKKLCTSSPLSEEEDDLLRELAQLDLLTTIRLQCPVDGCTIFIANQTMLNNHLIAVHMIKPWRCFLAACGRSYENVKNLESHLSQDHSMVNEWKCGFCFEDCGSHEALSAHNRRYHQRGTYQCEYTSDCQFRSSTPELIYRHQLQHINPTTAQTTEPSESSLLLPPPNDHQTARTRRKAKQYACLFENCGRTFRTGTLVRRHQLFHMKFKPYMCTKCGYRSEVQYATITHIRSVHMRLPAKVCEQIAKQIVDDRDPKELLFVDQEMIDTMERTHKELEQKICRIY